MRLLIGFALVLLVALYVRSPIDVVPDRIGGLGFLDDLIVIAVAVWWWRNRLEANLRRWSTGGSTKSPPPAADPAEPAARDPWAVLGIQPGASKLEIDRAYRQQIKLYHPDRVADLGEELQQVAHEKTIEIQRAYAEIGRRR